MAASGPETVSAFAVSTSFRWRSTWAVRNGLSSCCARRGSRASRVVLISPTAPIVYRMPPPDVRGIGIDLNDRGAVRIELAPGEIRAEQQQHVAVEDRRDSPPAPPIMPVMPTL